MKKLAVIILTLALLLSVAGCGGTSADAGKTATEPTGNVGGAPKATAEPVFSFGSYEGNVYKSAFAGFGCELGSDWVYYSEDELLELSQLTKEMMSEEAAEQLENASVIYDMMAQNGQTGSSVNIVFENLGLIMSKAVDEKTYLEASADQLLEELAGIGFEECKGELTTCTFLGEDHVSYSVSGTTQGISFYEHLLPVKCGRYMAVITFSSLMEDTTQELLDCFFKL